MTLGPSLLSRYAHVALIVWPWRTDEGYIQSDDLKGAASRFGRHFQALFPREAGALPETEVTAAFRTALDAGKDYRQWWRNLLAASDLKVDFADREPRIDVGQAALWEQLKDRIDADAMITLALSTDRSGAGADLAADLADLTGWDCVVRVGDRNLQTLWRRGLSDLHVHVGGSRFGHLAWFDLIDGLSGVDRYPGLTDDSDTSLADRILKGQAAHKALHCHLKRDMPEPLHDAPGRRHRWDIRRARDERGLLTTLWDPGLKLSDAVLRDLDGYLLAKSLFFRAARQPADTQPGLALFDDRYFRSTKRKSGFAEAYGASARLAMQGWGDALYFLLESPDLRRIELRSAPCAKADEYAALAKAFDRLATAVEKERRPKGPAADIRFAIHFKRSRKSGSPLHDMLVETDRESAALRLALRKYGHRKAMRNRFARIDVAGQERLTPVSGFAPYLRLVRGDEAVLDELENKFLESDPRWSEFVKWRELVERGEHRPSLGANRPGVTVHAGEDWADPLDGLHQVIDAIELVELRAGDGIGHGLAMTADVAAFSRTRRPWTYICKGAALDSLVWLFDLINCHDQKRRFAAALADLRSQIQHEASQIYEVPFGAILPEDMVWLRRARASLETPTVEKHGQARCDLFAKDGSAACRATRDRLVPADPARGRLDEAVVWAQRQVLDVVIHRRIVVEMNPASNLRISGAAGDPALSPAVKMLLEIENGLLASVNTDNPGAFMSRVENEYALLLAGCREHSPKIDEGRARGLLEKARWIGMHETWWPDRDLEPSAGEDEDSEDQDGSADLT